MLGSAPRHLTSWCPWFSKSGPLPNTAASPFTSTMSVPSTPVPWHSSRSLRSWTSTASTTAWLAGTMPPFVAWRHPGETAPRPLPGYTWSLHTPLPSSGMCPVVLWQALACWNGTGLAHPAAKPGKDPCSQPSCSPTPPAGQPLPRTTCTLSCSLEQQRWGQDQDENEEEMQSYHGNINAIYALKMQLRIP